MRSGEIRPLPGVLRAAKVTLSMLDVSNQASRPIIVIESTVVATEDLPVETYAFGDPVESASEARNIRIWYRARTATLARYQILPLYRSSCLTRPRAIG